MRWMHISDIHVNRNFNHVQSNVLRDELPNFITENHIEVDYLFITGDYRDAAYMKSPELQEKLHEQVENVADYILRIAKALHLPHERIFLVPGNHDLQRTESDEETIRKIKQTYPEIRESLSETETETLLNRFIFFDEIEHTVHPQSQEQRGASHRIYKTEDANILCLNTALMCYGKEKERECILDTCKIEELLRDANPSKPLIVLGHHNFNFFTEQEEENLKILFQKYKVYYLCGHSHKKNYSYDNNYQLFKIMVGATKHEKDAVPIVCITESFEMGGEIKLQFYQYTFGDKRGWRLDEETSMKIKIPSLGFIGENIKVSNIGYRVTKLPIMQTTATTKRQRTETKKILGELKAELCRLGGEQEFFANAMGLPVNVGIVIGYALHKRQRIKLYYQDRNGVFYNQSNWQIYFEATQEGEKAVANKTVRLNVYIQAKELDNGRAIFDRYVNKHASRNDRIITFINKEKYDTSYNLEASAQWLVEQIQAQKAELENQGAKKVEVCLFYNGFWGLALYLGNQLPTTYPIQLYDYAAKDEAYHKSFCIKPDIFK